MPLSDIPMQILLSAIYYAIVVLLFRIAGKRLAGQSTTFDLIVLISLSVAVQQATLREGVGNAAVFVITVFGLHLGLAKLCMHSRSLRILVRGAPCELIHSGQINFQSLRREGISVDELKAGLRKNGIEDLSKVKTAHLEETGQISAVLQD